MFYAQICSLCRCEETLSNLLPVRKYKEISYHDTTKPTQKHHFEYSGELETRPSLYSQTLKRKEELSNIFRTESQGLLL